MCTALVGWLTTAAAPGVRPETRGFRNEFRDDLSLARPWTEVDSPSPKHGHCNGPAFILNESQ